ncbi:MAG: M48 family metallopeptidase [Burkholderiales bacterium]|jgi:STE24 endopeptidase|nr:M48 family metallopeptidase [Rhodocyclaceae bacterium]MCA3022083.1 M48 family metallopeptidase [Rhodocyclaceae bacterium]MCA3044306.1 M48 family metallopeptidase [Rhodocyclaceae bacterium]MCA3052557.1 M48 family metallopeptidase [Rhodocyclaceae bacterium]MCA3056518.1 M48 family metallopeptidase [Rhodocyclaceae bacterium]
MTAASSFTFTLIFLAATAISLAFSVWLSLRHMRHVATHRHAVPAEFADIISLEAHQKAADYTLDKQRFGLAEEALNVVVLLGLTLGGGLAWLYLSTNGLFGNVYADGLAFVAAVGIVTGLIGLPFDVYRTFVIEAKHGFNKTTLRTYITDAVKGWALAVVIGGPLLFATLWLMEKMGGLWWLYVWLVWTGFSLLMIAVYPTYIAPLFNKFLPLEDTSLKTRIEALLAKCGFHAKGLFVMDGSKRSSHGNAYFTGLGKSKQIVFFDTLMQRLTPEEIEAVLAHELGHFKRRHIVKRMVAMFASSFVMLALMGWVIDKPWFYEGLGLPAATAGVAGVANATAASAPVAVSLVLFFTILPVFTFWMTPLSSLVSRKHEFEADAYAAEQTNARDLISALVKLYRDNASTLTPDPLHSAVYDSHPPAAIRIAHLHTFSTSTVPTT